VRGNRPPPGQAGSPRGLDELRAKDAHQGHR
jgi:hypothetical protein